MASGTYGVSGIGYNLKRLDDIVADLSTAIQAAIPGANTATQTVFGQLIGAIAGVVAEREEQNLAMWSAFSMTTAEGGQLDNLGLFRGVSRNTDESDAAYRNRLLQGVMSAGTPVSGLERLRTALLEVPGVTLVRVAEVPAQGGYEVSVVGGAGTTIAETIFAYHPVGAVTLGNRRLTVNNDCGIGSDINFYRASETPINIRFNVRSLPNVNGCGVTSASEYQQAAYDWLINNAETITQPIALTLHAEQFYEPFSALGSIAIDSAEYSTDGGTTYQAFPMTLNQQQYASFLYENITVNLT